jgi:hypothetical protein
MISYKDKNTKIDVLLDKKTVGYILKNKENLFQYFPKGNKEGGSQFKTISEVKKSLESD